MKPYQSEEKIITKQTPKKYQDKLKIESISNTEIKTAGKEMQDVVDSAQKEDTSQKFSMSKLCEAFVERCNESTIKVFQTKTLIQDFGVKQRRIYDLMNIMEGCGCLKKLSKGKYQWIGVQQSEFVSPESQKGDTTSLRQIAARIKLLFSQTKGIISFSQINDLLMTENKDKSVNPASIRRRIYECCKVLRILGFIDKIGKDYQWVFDTDGPRIKIETQNKKKSTRRLKRHQISQNQLIMQILRRYDTVQKINQFMNKVTTAFGQAHKIKKEQVIYQQ